jgi:hypothetical protein
VVVAATLKTAGAFLFLLPSGRPRQRDDEGAVVAAGAAFFPLPLGQPGPRFSGTPASPEAPAARGAAEEEAAAEAFAARASKVLLLRLPFGRPRFRGTGGDPSGTSTSFLLSAGISPSLGAEPLGDDITGLVSVRRNSELREEWGMPCAVNTLGI